MKVKIKTCANSPIPSGTVVSVFDQASNHVWVRYKGSELPYAWSEVTIVEGKRIKSL